MYFHLGHTKVEEKSCIYFVLIVYRGAADNPLIHVLGVPPQPHPDLKAMSY